MPTTYKDWQVKEESKKTLKKSATGSLKSSVLKQKKPAQTTIKRAAANSKNRKSKSRERQTSEDTHAFKQRVQQQYNNFMTQVEHGQIFDDDSLLQDSQQEMPKEQKKAVLAEQRARRKTTEVEQKRKSEAEAKKKQQNLQALNMRFKSQMLTFRKQKEREERDQERQRRLTAKHNAKIVEMHRPDRQLQGTRKYNSNNAQEQMNDLRNWIEQQMEQANMHKETSSLAEPSKSEQDSSQISKLRGNSKGKDTVENSSMLSNVSMEQLAVKKDQKQKLLKHQLPGNSLLAEAEEKKLGARKDRYGVFNSNTHDFDRVVEIQKQKQNEREKRFSGRASGDKASSHMSVDDSEPISSGQQKQGKAVFTQKVLELADRVDLQLSKKPEADGSEDELTEDSCDKIPVRDSSKSSFKVSNVKPEPVRERILARAEQPDIDPRAIPGVGSLKNHFKIYEDARKEKESAAVLVIQKFLRGHWGRTEAARKKFMKQEADQVEYGGFDNDIKFNQDFNLNRYLNEKKRMRAKNAMIDSISMDEISEAIGESGSISNKDKAGRSAVSAQLQNFFANNQKQSATTHDPLSLISIFAKRNGKIPTDGDKSSLSYTQTSKAKSSSRDKVRKPSQSKQKQKYDDIKDSVIDEEIYSEAFEDSLPGASGSISEDIQQVSASGGSGSGNLGSKKLQNLKQKTNIFGFKNVTQEKSSSADVIESDSIAVESFAEKQDTDRISESIAEESHLNATGSKRTKDEEDSIIEESIIREEYDNDNFDSYNASQSVQARNRVRFGMASSQQSAPPPPVTRVEKKKQEDLTNLEEAKTRATNERQRMVGELMSEMRQYEQSLLSTQMVDRMEKVVASSLAQKDQLIMAQRLHELEMERNHKEEINRIREEQIKLMSQLMLLGAGAGQSNVSQKQRDEMLESIQKIVDKPIEIKKEEVHVSYSVTPDQLGHSASISKPKQSYLEEYEAEKKRSKQLSSGKYSDFIEEDIAMRSAASKSKHTSSIQESIDDIAEDIQSMAEDSIKESIMEDSAIRSSVQKPKSQPKTSAYEDYKNKQFKEAINNKSGVSQFYNQIELAILKEKESREQALRKDYSKHLISRDAYDRKLDELDRWVADERRELKTKHQQVVDSCAEMGSYIKRLESDKKNPLGRHVAANVEQIDEDSNDSEDVKKALHEAHMLGQGITGQSAEQKYLQKKRDTALKLMEEKEKAIQEALKSKMANLEKENADEMLAKALEIDVEAEAEKLYRIAREKIEASQSYDMPSNRSNLTTSKEKDRPKKNVQWASPTATRNLPEEKYSSSRLSGDQIEDSIGESIQIGESYSQSIKSMSLPQQDTKATSQPVQQQQQLDQAASPAQSSSAIDTDYSNDFAEESIQSSYGETSKSLGGSKQKLQAKAKDLEESNAYSETFEEESLGQSAQLPKEPKDPTSQTKMDPVVEESIDESIAEASKFSGDQNTERAQSASGDTQQQSLPSEDQEIVQTARSVEWQIEIAQDSERTKLKSARSESEEDYTEDDFVDDEDQIEEESHELKEGSSDINQREEMNDLDSCPDDFGKSSVSMNEVDIETKADRITEELFDLIMQGYKLDQGFDLNEAKNKQSAAEEEEEFKDKFPWTLDKQPEPEAPKSTRSSTSSTKTAGKPAPTPRERADAEFIKKHEAEQAKIKEQQQRVSDFVDFMIKRCDLKKLVKSLDKPIEQDPLKVLAQIQAYEDENSTLQGMSDSTGVIAAQQILPPAFFNKVDREFVITQRMKSKNLSRQAAEESDQLTVSQEDNENMQNVHHYAIYEAFNEALDQERPYKSKGQPMPWSKNTRVVKQETTIGEAKKILEAAKAKVVEWSQTGAGTKYAPLPAHPPQTQDEMGDEIAPPLLAEGEEERKNILRQERLSELMTQDIHNNDGLWVDYEIEDTQTRFDVADMVLAHLAGEVAEFLAHKGKI